MRCYENTDGLQLWTFQRGGPKTKPAPVLLWDYAAERGYKYLTRIEATSWLRTFRRKLEVVLDQ